MNSNNIKKIRREKNISVTELAAKLNMSQSNLTKIENSQVELKIDVAKKIAEILNTPLETLTDKGRAEQNPIIKLTLLNPKCLNLDKETKLTIPAYLCKEFPQTTALYIAEDDTMAPHIPQQSLVLIDTSCQDFNTDGVYLTQINHKLYLRRLQNTFTDEINIVCEHKVYPPQRLPSSSVKVIGKALFVLHTKKL